MSRQIEINLPPGLEKAAQFLRKWPAILGILIVIGLFTSIYQVPAESDGVVLRFGEYSHVVPPGLHFKAPYGIDTVEIVPTRRQLKAEFGFATQGATNPYQLPTDPREEKSMVTGDLNLGEVTWVVQYRIISAYDYLFNVREPEATLRGVSESVMREVVGDRTIDEVLTIGRQEIEQSAALKMGDLVQRYGLGLQITQVQLKDVNPPPPVQPSFNEVNQAQQERESLINKAQGEYNREVPRATGDAARLKSEAEGYAVERINLARGDAAKFDLIFAEYEKAPEITRKRLYLETMTKVFPMFGKKIILDENASSVLPLLPLDGAALPLAPAPVKPATR